MTNVRVNVGLLSAWVAVVFLVLGAFVVFVPMTGWGWTGGLEPLGCGPSGLCSVDEVEADEVVVESRVESVAMRRLLECQRYGLSGCEDLRSFGDVSVQVIVSDALLSGGGMLLSEGASGRELRYVSLISQYGMDYGSFYCAYGGLDSAVYASAVAVAPEGAEVLFTSELRWGLGSSLFRTYDDRGDPACRIRILDGKRLDD